MAKLAEIAAHNARRKHPAPALAPAPAPPAKEDKQPRARLMDVGPEQALKWLEQNTNNRDVRDRVVGQYAREMKSGGWRISDQAISFSEVQEDGKRILLNGQHRLFAVLESGATIQSFVIFDLPKESQQVMDIGLFRTTNDRFTLRGDMGKVGRREVGIARAMVTHHKANSWTDEESRQFLVQHRDAIHFAEQNVRPGIRGISSVAVCAAIARGFYHVERAELERFCRILTTNMPEGGPGESAIFVLRRHLTEKAGMGGFGRQDAYSRTERALLAFLRQETVTKLYAAETEVFPIPGEEEWNRPVERQKTTRKLRKR